MGPNVKRLIATKMAKDAIPNGQGLNAALGFLSSKERIIGGARGATSWVESAIAVVRGAGEPNPWKSADDEVIAEELLRRIDEKASPEIKRLREIKNRMHAL